MDRPPLEILALHLATERDARALASVHNTRRQALKDESLPTAHLVPLTRRGNILGYMVILEKTPERRT